MADKADMRIKTDGTSVQGKAAATVKARVLETTVLKPAVPKPRGTNIPITLSRGSSWRNNRVLRFRYHCGVPCCHW